MSPRKIGSVLLMLALVHLFAPAVHALPPVIQQGPRHSQGIFTAVWEWLGSQLALDGHLRLQVIREKAGSQMDPNGVPQNNRLVVAVDQEDNK